MNNLSIENLSQKIQTGDFDSNVRVAREMQNQGMPAPAGDAAGTFSEMLRKSVEVVNQDQIAANTAIHDMVAGRNKNIHETMLSIEKADTSLKLMMQVRNKVLDAYREIMKMQV